MSMIMIDSKVSVPMTNEQKEMFKRWAREKYADYESYKKGMREENEVERYVHMNVLTAEMKSMWIESERYVKVRSSDLGVKRIQMYRQRIAKKVKYMKRKLGEYAYKDELLEMRRRERERMREGDENRRNNFMRIVRNELGEERYLELMNREDVTEENIHRYLRMSRLPPPYQYDVPPRPAIPVSVKYITKEISLEEGKSDTKEECSICMEKHNMSAVMEGKCGHQMGKSCFEEWAKKSNGHVYCPLCRGNCDTVYELGTNG
jgi:hypothetical protein